MKFFKALALYLMAVWLAAVLMAAADYVITRKADSLIMLHRFMFIPDDGVMSVYKTQ